ncbi:conserved exported protein of unknown function [Magnetospirillum sp. XM-1]|uniref:hypothetical protein n=1 Tax=Magnetospirillum sp. XM-1 TaxID=1663591 RepID=UPI00073DBC6B|nr:hypothetical protein [Magnetospirillum sp. XM-1]CUW39273.1 conserved exported protein of unknown function [Magnetospirillum sp. XM-1]
MRPILAALCLLPLFAAGAWADQATAIATVRAQPKVLDASIDDRGNLYVVVKNETLSWEQYGAAMCRLVRPHQARVFQAHIIDMTSVGKGAKPAQWKRLAQVNCAAIN